MSAFAAFVLAAALALPAYAQTGEGEPWWPHPLWGAEDEAGSSNWITPEKILEAIRLVRTGELYELGRVYDAEMPRFGNREYEITVPEPAGPFGKNRLLGVGETIRGDLGQIGTQLDGLGHIGERIAVGDGAERDVFYNGFTREEIYDENGLRRLGVEKLKPILTAGVLIDVAGFRGPLEGGYEITLEDVRGALARQGIDEASIRPGDALLFRYGVPWDEAQYRAAPGYGREVVEWIVERRPSLVGSDATGEVFPYPEPGLVFPMHQELLMKEGILLLEEMDLEALARDTATRFLFVVTPLRLRGATGSPVRPIAIL